MAGKEPTVKSHENGPTYAGRVPSLDGAPSRAVHYRWTRPIASGRGACYDGQRGVIFAKCEVISTRKEAAEKLRGLQTLGTKLLLYHQFTKSFSTQNVLDIIYYNS